MSSATLFDRLKTCLRPVLILQTKLAVEDSVTIISCTEVPLHI